jgi:hypothetical protein
VVQNGEVIIVDDITLAADALPALVRRPAPAIEAK